MPFDSDSVYWATHGANDRIKHVIKLAQQYQEDPSKEDRVKEMLCICCYYRSAIAGQAFTKWTCAICKKQSYFPNTNIPTLCKECAIEHGLCVHCGSDMETVGLVSEVINHE